MIKKQRLIVLFTSNVMKKSLKMFKRLLVYTPPDLSPRFTCRVNLSNTNKKKASLLNRGMKV